MMPQVRQIPFHIIKVILVQSFNPSLHDAVKGGTYYPITVKVGEPSVTPLHASDMH